MPGVLDADPDLGARLVREDVLGDQTTGTRMTMVTIGQCGSGPYGRMAPCRALADLGIRIGTLPTGPTNSVLDVPGVGLGHATVWRDEPDPPAGRGVARTGVTRARCLAEDAFARPLAAGGAVLNGAGECTGFLTARRVGRWPRRRSS